MLPYLLTGIQSYLSISMLINVINTSAPTFLNYVRGYGGLLQQWASFLQSQYEPAVKGIIKSDIPSSADVLSFLAYAARASGYVINVLQDEFTLDASDPYSYFWDPQYPPGPPGCPRRGYAWNGVYGAIDTYPPFGAYYGTYQPAPPVPVPASAPSYLIDVINTDNLVAEIAEPFEFPYMEWATLVNWTFPWVEDKLILGTMARWKAIYLLKGYDKVWSILQTLRVLTNQSPLPPVTLAEETLTTGNWSMLATGNWSMRELCTVLNVSGAILDGVTGEGLTAGGVPGTYSLSSLLQAFDNIAKGNWAKSAVASSGRGLARPASFRGLLAEAAV